LAEARANHYDCESEPDCWAIADAIRSLLLGASPEGRGSATPRVGPPHEGETSADGWTTT
jgi:hypothetical protein